MCRILLVEDNELNRDMLSRRLSHRGYEVILAANGRQGIDMARSQKPDVMPMDLSLPEIDGWQVARILKNDAGTRGIPVVALTAHAMLGDREKPWRRGATTTPSNRSICRFCWASSTG